MAIALDTATFQDVGASGQTFSHTVTGTNTILIVGRFWNSADGTFTGVTYNGVALTRINTQSVNGTTSSVDLWYLINPATGAHNVVLGGTNNKGNATSVSYTGARQSSVPDASASATAASATSVTTSVTTVANNDWVVCYNRGDVDGNGTNNGGVTTTARGGQNYYLDSNGTVTVGSKTVSVSNVSSQGWGLVAAAIAPAVSSSGFLAFM